MPVFKSTLAINNILHKLKAVVQSIFIVFKLSVRASVKIATFAQHEINC